MDLGVMSWPGRRLGVRRPVGTHEAQDFGLDGSLVMATCPTSRLRAIRTTLVTWPVGMSGNVLGGGFLHRVTMADRRWEGLPFV